MTTSELQLLTNPGQNYVLLSDADGNASWADPTEFSLADEDWFFTKEGNLYTNAPKVGISTSSPRGKLEITLTETDSTIYGIILNQLSADANAYEIRFDRDSVEEWAVGTRNWGDTLPAFFLWNEHRQLASLFVEKESGRMGIENHHPRATLDVNGSFKVNRAGIGTDPPHPDSTWKLFVEGGIKAREIKVTMYPFADYVFAPGYPLLSISDYGRFIAENRHLPGIPSESDVVKNDGINLGEMQVKLLEKVEEQALYIVDLQNQIDELKQAVSRMKEDRP